MMPQRYDGFNMGFSQVSPGFRNSTIQSHHGEPDVPAHGYDFNRMLQQHLSDGFRSNLHNIQENEQDENAENPSTPETSPQHQSTTSVMTGSVLRGASHREGPMNSSHDRSLFHSLYGQTGTYEPLSSDLTTADMCLSKNNYQIQRKSQQFLLIYIQNSVFFLNFVKFQVLYTYTNYFIDKIGVAVAHLLVHRHQINSIYGKCRIETDHKWRQKAIHDQAPLHIRKMFGQPLKKRHFCSQRKHNNAPNGCKIPLNAGS